MSYHDKRCEGWFINGVVVYNLVLLGVSLNEVMDKYGRWKNGVEGKCLRVNVDKTKGIQLSFGKKSSVSKVDPIQCTKCQRWVHRR